MNWNTGQLGILRELGHEPMLLAAVFGAGPLGAACADMRLQTTSRDSDVQEKQEQSRLKAAPTNSRLAEALARAAGGGDLSGLALDLERLRREPALKRALWPQLRALRRGR